MKRTFPETLLIISLQGKSFFFISRKYFHTDLPECFFSFLRLKAF